MGIARQAGNFSQRFVSASVKNVETGRANKSVNQTSGAQRGNGGESLAREGKQS